MLLTLVLSSLLAVAQASVPVASPTDAPSGAVAPEAGGPVLLNDASIEQLAALDGVAEADARAIVALRDDRGGISSVEELRVLGLPEPTLASLRSGTALEVRIRRPLPDMAFTSANEVLSRFKHEPTVNQVQMWAADYANISPERVRRWLTQSSTFASLPEVQLTYYVRDDFDQGFEYFDENGLDPRTPDSNPQAVIQDADSGRQTEYRVRLTFDLDKLIMSSERIRVINEAQDIVKLRDQVLGEVTRLYFERRRLQAERLLSPKSDPLALVKEELRLMELTANLDALTGGAFSAGVARGNVATASP
jgi:hypothetical protein